MLGCLVFKTFNCESPERDFSVHPNSSFLTNPRANVGDADSTCVQYIGMQGDHTHDVRAPVHATYELLGTPHSTDAKDERAATEGV